MLSIVCLSNTCEYLVLALDMGELFSACPLGVIREYLSHCIILTHRYFYIISPLSPCHIHPQIGFNYHRTLGYTTPPYPFGVLREVIGRIILSDSQAVQIGCPMMGAIT